MSITTLVWEELSGAAIAVFGVLILLAIGGPVLLSLLGVESLTVGTPGPITYLFSFTNTPTEISFGVGPGVLSVGAVIGLDTHFFGATCEDRTRLSRRKHSNCLARRVGTLPSVLDGTYKHCPPQ